jgi:hypothetical protein
MLGFEIFERSVSHWMPIAGSLVTLEQMRNALMFAGDIPFRENARWECPPLVRRSRERPCQSRHSRDVTSAHTKVTLELRKRMPVGHLHARICR